jgi:hypothetical protein
MEYSYKFKAGDKIICTDKTNEYNYVNSKFIFTVKYVHDGMYCLVLDKYYSGAFFDLNYVDNNFDFYKGQLTDEEIEEWLK